MNREADVCDLVRETLMASTDWRVRELAPVTSHNRNFSTHLTLRVERDGADSKMIFVKFVRGITDDRERLEQLAGDIALERVHAVSPARSPGRSRATGRIVGPPLVVSLCR